MPAIESPWRQWDQEQLKDVIESMAFGVFSQRHIRYFSGAGDSSQSIKSLARGWDWQREQLKLVQDGPSISLAWLPLKRPAGSGESMASESVAALPLWFASLYVMPPAGNCDGRWGETDAPLVAGHLVYVRHKYFVMRALGWWYHAAAPLLRQGTPGEFRVLVLRQHKVQMLPGGLQSLRRTMLRWMLLALAAGRRAVLPFVQCSMAPSKDDAQQCAVGADLVARLTLVPIRDEALCDETAAHTGWRAPPQVAAQRGPPRALPRSATPGAPHGCCVLLTNQWAHERFGLTPLRDGPLLGERDLGQLHKENPGITSDVVRLSELRNGRTALDGGTLKAAALHSDAEVLVVDAGGAADLGTVIPSKADLRRGMALIRHSNEASRKILSSRYRWEKVLEVRRLLLADNEAAIRNATSSKRNSS